MLSLRKAIANQPKAQIYKRMRGDGVIGDTPGDAVRKRWERLERQAMSDPRFLEELENFMAHEQAKQPWRWHDLVVKEQERAKQSFDEALAGLEEEIELDRKILIDTCPKIWRGNSPYTSTHRKLLRRLRPAWAWSGAQRPSRPMSAGSRPSTDGRKKALAMLRCKGTRKRPRRGEEAVPEREAAWEKLVAVYKDASADDRKTAAAALVERAKNGKRDAAVVTITPGTAAVLFFDYNKQNRGWSYSYFGELCQPDNGQRLAFHRTGNLFLDLRERR